MRIPRPQRTPAGVRLEQCPLADRLNAGGLPQRHLHCDAICAPKVAHGGERPHGEIAAALRVNAIVTIKLVAYYAINTRARGLKYSYYCKFDRKHLKFEPIQVNLTTIVVNLFGD